MSYKRGRLIVFEGVDGVGKSTLAQQLTHYLLKNGVLCEFRAFPGCEVGTLGQHIYEFHHDLHKFKVNTISPLSLQLLHVAAHIDEIRTRILPTIMLGKTIILDRYWWSTYVYGRASGESRKQLRNILSAELEEWKTILPQVVFLITRKVPLKVEAETEFLERWSLLKTVYHDLATKEAGNYPIVTINNDGSPDEAFDQIRFALDTPSGTKASKPPKSSKMPNQQESTQLPLALQIRQGAHSHNGTVFSFSRLSPAKPTEVFDTFWKFATERQEIFFRKVEGQPPPWTADPILHRYKFTNAYRAADRVSQYLIKHVIYQGEQTTDEVFFRILLFKIFNRIDTWKLLLSKLGAIGYREYTFERYDTILTEAIEQGVKIFSAAYIMPSGNTCFGHTRKHRNYLKLLEQMMQDELPVRLTQVGHMHEAFELIRSYPMMGNFLAYQFVTDLNYSNLTNFSEMEFVVPGPGAKDGIRKCFDSLGGLNEADIIRVVAEQQEGEFQRLGLNFRTLWGRRLQLIDCQNLFCEVDKYARVAHPEVQGISSRNRIKQIYQENQKPIVYWFPPKWGINHLIINEGR